MSTIYMVVPKKPEEGIGFSGTSVTEDVSCRVSWDLKLGSLEEQQVLLNSEPSSDPSPSQFNTSENSISKLTLLLALLWHPALHLHYIKLLRCQDPFSGN